MKRRAKTSARTRAIVAAAKDIRAGKLAFEREASTILSHALGFEVTVRIKRQRLGDELGPVARKAARRPARQVKAELADQLHAAVVREQFRDAPPFARGFIEGEEE